MNVTLTRARLEGDEQALLVLTPDDVVLAQAPWPPDVFTGEGEPDYGFLTEAMTRALTDALRFQGLEYVTDPSDPFMDVVQRAVSPGGGFPAPEFTVRKVYDPEELVVWNTEVNPPELIGSYINTEEDVVRYRRPDGSYGHAPNDCIIVMQAGRVPLGHGPTLPLGASGSPAAGREVSEMFGSGDPEFSDSRTVTVKHGSTRYVQRHVTVDIQDTGVDGNRRTDVATINVMEEGRWMVLLTWQEARALAKAITDVTDTAEFG